MRKDLKTLQNDIFINTNTGDFEVFNSDRQHQVDVILAAKGEFKEFPFIGAEAKKQLNAGIEFQALLRRVQVQLESDGYRLEEFKVVGSEVDVVATLKES